MVENAPIPLEKALATRQYWVEFKQYENSSFWACLYADGQAIILLDMGWPYRDTRHGRTTNVTRRSYNKTWRLWKVKPTDEQRKAAQWE